MATRTEKILLGLMLVFFVISGITVVNNASLKAENAKLHQDTSIKEIYQKENVVVMVNSMNTEENAKRMSSVIKHLDNTLPILGTQLAQETLKNLDAIRISIEGSEQPLCFIIGKGLFPDCQGSRNVTSISMSYNDIDFAYKNQELILSTMQSGQISSYNMSRLLTARMLYDLQNGGT